MPLQPTRMGKGRVSPRGPCLSSGVPQTTSPSSTWLPHLAAMPMRPQTLNTGQQEKPPASQTLPRLQGPQPWAHLAAQVMGMRWVA